MDTNYTSPAFVSRFLVLHRRYLTYLLPKEFSMKHMANPLFEKLY